MTRAPQGRLVPNQLGYPLKMKNYLLTCTHSPMACIVLAVLNTVQNTYFVHQLFVTTGFSGPGNSRDIDFSLCKAWISAQHCRDILMIKVLPNMPLKPRPFMASLGLKSKPLLFHGTAGTAEVKNSGSYSRRNKVPI